MGTYYIKVEPMPYGLYLTTTISGQDYKANYKGRYKHKNIGKALQEFSVLILKYQGREN